MRPTWHDYALDIAAAAARRSEDPYMKVGACILRADNSVAGVGYNGVPPGIELEWADREQRRQYVLHAEINAFRYCTLADTIGGLLAVTHLPCEQCIKTIAAYGIKTVVYANELDWNTYNRDVINQVASTFGITLNMKEKE